MFTRSSPFDLAQLNEINPVDISTFFYRKVIPVVRVKLIYVESSQ